MQQQGRTCPVYRKVISNINSVGDVVEIYTAGKFEGEAELLARLPDREVPYIQSNCIGCGAILSFIKHRYRVKFISGPNKGWTTARKIPQFHHIGSILSTKTRYEEEE